MAASRDDIVNWLEEGKALGATHVIIACDTFDYDDYPVFVKPDKDVRERAKEVECQSMQTVMEIYNLNVDIASQLAERRSFHY